MRHWVQALSSIFDGGRDCERWRTRLLDDMFSPYGTQAWFSRVSGIAAAGLAP